MEKHLSEMTLAELTREEGIRCSCGKIHRCGLRYFRAGAGAGQKASHGGHGYEYGKGGR